MSGRRSGLLLFLGLLGWLGVLAWLRTGASPQEAFSGDATNYYGTLRSLVVDHNWSLLEEFGTEDYLDANSRAQVRMSAEDLALYKAMLVKQYGWTPERFDFEWELIKQAAAGLTLEQHRATLREGYQHLPNGPPNDFPAGFAFFALPFYAAAHVLIGPGDGSKVLPGYERHYRLAANFAQAFWVAVGGVLLLALLRRWFGDPTALPAAVAILLASNVSWYVGPFTSHAVGFFTACLFLWAWLRVGSGPCRMAEWAAAGAATGLLLLCRPQNGVLLVLPVFLVGRECWRHGRDGVQLRRLAGCLLLAAACALAAFSFQLLYWHGYYGTILHWPHQALLQSRELFTGFVNVLVARRNGMFAMHPLTALGAAGLLVLAWRQRPLGPLLLLAFVLHVLTSAAVPDWWGSHATGPLGHRRFDGCLPLFAIGIATLLDAMRSHRVPCRLAAAAVCLYGVAEQIWYGWPRA